MRCKVCGFDLDGNDCLKCAHYIKAEEEAMHWEFRDRTQELKERW